MRTIAHISDLHFGRIREDAEEALLADLQKIQPSVIAISGDLTQRALRKQFKRARAYLERLPAPFIVVPGNHDIPFFDITRRFLLPLHRYKNYISKQLNPLYIDNEIALLGVNSARSLTVEAGKIGRRQLKKIEQTFLELPDDVFRIVVTHHPFCRPPDVHFRKIVAGSKKALQCFERCGVSAILTGHFHRVHSLDLQTVYPWMQKSMIHSQAGTAISTRTKKEPNSYNVISIEAKKITIDVREWTGSSFEVTDKKRFKRSKKGWSQY